MMVQPLKWFGIGVLLMCTTQVVSIAADKIQSLPAPALQHPHTLNQLIAERRSVRNFSGKALAADQLAHLLWAAQGITENKKGFRAVPSAGALYPLEIYVVDTQGVRHYLPHEHALKVMTKKDLRKDLAKTAWGQTSIADAPTTILITGIYKRTTKKYGDRGVRYVHIEAGHAAQNIALMAVSLKLSSLPIGAFHDRDVQNLLDLPQDHVPLYLIPMGYQKSCKRYQF